MSDDWYNTGWDDVDQAEKDTPSGGFSPFRIWIPPEQTRRLLWIDDDPFQFWEHAVKINGSWQNNFVCRMKNKLDETCYFCDQKKSGGKNVPINLYYIGFFTVIDFTAWTANNGKVYQYDRKLYGAKLGSKDKPGILKKLRRLKERHGRLAGLLFDIYRSGSKAASVGDEFEVVEKIDPREIHEYARRIGVNPDEKKWVPFNYPELFKPVSNEEMRQVWGGGGGGGPQNQQRNEETVGGGSGGRGWGNTGRKSETEHPVGGDEDVEY